MTSGDWIAVLVGALLVGGVLLLSRDVRRPLALCTVGLGIGLAVATSELWPLLAVPVVVVVEFIVVTPLTRNQLRRRGS